MKTLYLHIGTPKTATTAIQTFCYDNREVLEAKGYCYPMFDYSFENVQRYRNGHFLVCRVLDERRKRIPDKQAALTMEGIGKLLEVFETRDRVILSDEGIWNRGFFEDTHCWSKIRQELIGRGIVVKVIVYFRRQDDFLYSWWNQQVKEGMLGSSVMDWDTVTDKLPYIKLDYYEMLDRIAEYVGKEQITVRVFDRKRFVGGTIQADFLDALGLSMTDEYRIQDSLNNPSLLKNDIEIKRILNCLPELDKRSNACFRRVVTKLSENGTENREWSMFSDEEDAAFMERFREGNAGIAREYLHTDAPLFAEPESDREKWSPQNEQMMREMVRFTGLLAMELMRENDALRAELQVQKRHISNIRYKMQHPVKALSGKLRRQD